MLISEREELIFISGLVGFTFRPPSDGTVHSETISFLVGGRLAELYWAVASASITGAAVTNGSLQGATVSVPALPVTGTGVGGGNGTAANGFVAVGVAVDVTGATSPTLLGVSGGMDASRTALWYLGSVQTAFDAAESRLRITVTLNAANGVDITQLAFYVTLLADSTFSFIAGTGAVATLRKRSRGKSDSGSQA